MDLKGKTIVILGAGGGIGRALADKFKDLGAMVIPVTKKEVDLTKIDQVENFSKEISQNFPKISVFINTAGIGVYQGLEQLAHVDWQNSLDVNLTGPLFFIKGIMPSLDKKDSVVINLGSGLGKKPYYQRRLPYIISKFALRGMSLALSRDFEGKKPDFCLITLGSVMTDFGPGGLKKREKLQKGGKLYFTPDWVAEKIVDIVKDVKRHTEYTFYPKDYIKGAVSG